MSGSMRTAVATFGFGRPDHFSRMLASLGACPEIQSKSVDVFHFLDGGEGSQQDELTKVIVDSGLPFVKIVARSENFGVGRQLISARREIFDEHGYDRMILVEDDIELNLTFLTTLLRLADWASQYNDIGTVQVWNVENGSKEEFQQHLDEIELTNRHFVSYCMFKSTWDAIKETLYKYEQSYLLKKPYRNRPHYRIRAFMRRRLKQGRKTPPSPRLDPPVEAIHNPFPTVSWRWAPTSQDAITSLAMYLAGLHRVTTRVPHAFYFGVTGVHCTPELYEQMGFNDQGYWQWQADDVPTTFTIRYQDGLGAWLKSSYR